MKKNRTNEYPLIKRDRIETLLWDWNGTLLDDVDKNVHTINVMLSNRGKRNLSVLEYKRLFCFPVKTFYEKIGFDLQRESIEEISIEYHAIYKLPVSDVRLNPDAIAVLSEINKKGISQYILSACIKHDLLRLTEQFNLQHYFKAIYGTDDICANGKIGIGRFLIQKHSLDPARTLIIGDTLHDAEVAKSLGTNYLLYSGGHNSNQLLTQEGMTITDLKKLIALI